MLQCPDILILGIVVEDGGITYQLVSTPKTNSWPLDFYRQSQYVY